MLQKLICLVGGKTYVESLLMAVCKSISWIYTVAEFYIHSCPSIMPAQKGEKKFLMNKFSASWKKVNLLLITVEISPSAAESIKNNSKTPSCLGNEAVAVPNEFN